MPPWEIEDAAPAIWMDRWAVWKEAQVKAQKKASKAKPGARQVI